MGSEVAGGRWGEGEERKEEDLGLVCKKQKLKKKIKKIRLK